MADEPSHRSPRDADVVASAEAAIAEARRQIDFQIKAADGLDTKAAAIVTFAGVAAGIAIGRLHLDTEAQRLSAAVAGVVLATLLVSAGQALRPRAGWSYGVDLLGLIRLVDSLPHKTVLLSLADSLAEARGRNAVVLGAKQVWYERGLRGIVATLLALGWMIQTGGIK